MMVMPWGRVGSNLLFSAIAQRAQKVFGADGFVLKNENLNSLIPDRQDQLDWAWQFYRDTDKPFLGSKQNSRAIKDLDGVLDILVDTGAVIISIRRENVLKAAISQMRVEEFARLTREKEGIARWGLKDGDKTIGPIEIDTARLIKIIKSFEEADERLKAALANRDHYALTYEEILEDTAGTIESICGELGLAGIESRLVYKKATPDNLSLAISNLSEVEAALPERLVALM